MAEIPLMPTIHSVIHFLQHLFISYVSTTYTKMTLILLFIIDLRENDIFLKAKEKMIKTTLSQRKLKLLSIFPNII